MTSVYTGEEFEHRVRRRPTTTQPRARPILQKFGIDPVKTLEMPLIAADYNDQMNAVDIGDQLRQYNTYKHAICRGGWQAIAWTFLLDTTLINSYLLQARGRPEWPHYTTQTAWRQALIDALIKAYSATGGSRQRYRCGDEFTPIAQHHHVNRKKRSRCLACQGYKVGEARSQSQQKPLQRLSDDALNRRNKSKQTSWGCDVCDVAICTPGGCWDFYHSTIS